MVISLKCREHQEPVHSGIHRKYHENIYKTNSVPQHLAQHLNINPISRPPLRLSCWRLLSSDTLAVEEEDATKQWGTTGSPPPPLSTQEKAIKIMLLLREEDSVAKLKAIAGDTPLTDIKDSKTTLFFDMQQTAIESKCVSSYWTPSWTSTLLFR